MGTDNALTRLSQGRISVDVDQILDNHKMRYPPVFRPSYSVKVGDTALELWVSHRRLPLMLIADGMIVPVSPNLKMVTGVAKYVRDIGSDAVQYEANRAAPLKPGEVFIGPGAKYRYKYTALAVIYDSQMRSDPSIIRIAIKNATAGLAQRGCKSVILPDFTENMVAQPNQLGLAAYKETAEATAASLSAAIQACAGAVAKIKLWSWNPVSTDVYLRELKRLERAGH